MEVEDYEISYAEGGFIPIIKLHPGLKWDWRIKARVIKKSERRTWKNERGEGYLMNVDLMDEEGSQIQATLFKEMVDKFCDKLIEGNVYMMSGGLVKEATGKFAARKNNQCLVFDKYSEINEIVDDGTVAQIQGKENNFNFTTIAEIGDMNPNDSVDLIGIAYVVGPMG